MAQEMQIQQTTQKSRIIQLQVADGERGETMKM